MKQLLCQIEYVFKHWINRTCLTLTALKKYVIRCRALCCVRERAVRHLPRSEGKFTASSLTLSTHLTAVRSLDKLLDSSNSFWCAVMKSKCWSICLKVNLRFLLCLTDWPCERLIEHDLAMHKSRQIHRECNSVNLPFNHLLWMSVLFFDWSTLEMAR